MDNKYTLTGLTPVISVIGNSSRRGVYCQYGDPLLLKDLCREQVEVLLGTPVLIPILVPTQIEISASLVTI